MSTSFQNNKYFPWFLVVLVLVSLAGTQALYERSSQDFHKELKRSAITFSEPLVPSVPVLKILSFGNPSMIADILWLQTIQYFGSYNPYGKYAALGSLLNSLTQLDPKYEYPYAFGLIVLPFMDQSDMAITLGQRAQTALPDNGLLTYYLATVYHLNLKDYRNAALYYQKAADLPGSPTSAKRMAGVTLGELSGTLSDRLVALEFWKTVYENSKDADEKKRAEDWFHHMEIVYTIEKQSEAYKAQTGQFPSNQQELVAKGLLPFIFNSPIGRELILHADTGKVTFDTLLPEN